MLGVKRRRDVMSMMDGICGSDYRGGERKSRIRKEIKKSRGAREAEIRSMIGETAMNDRKSGAREDGAQREK